MAIDLNLYELYYYPFIVSIDKCDGTVILMQIDLVEYLPHFVEYLPPPTVEVNGPMLF